MGFAQWFWRLFLVFTGLIVAHVLVVSLLIARHAGSSTPGVSPLELWGTASVAIAAGAVAVRYCIRRIVQPLKELSRHVHSASGQTARQPGSFWTSPRPARRVARCSKSREPGPCMKRWPARLPAERQLLPRSSPPAQFGEPCRCGPPGCRASHVPAS